MHARPSKEGRSTIRGHGYCLCVKQGASTFPHSFEPAGYVLIGPALDGDLIGDKETGPPEGRPFVLIAA